MSFSTSFQCYILILLLLFGHSVSAQRGADSLQTIQTLELYKRNFKEVIPVQVLSGKELQRLNSHSVADALRYFSGVQIKDYGGIGGLKTINIRSLGSHHTGVFYDGIQLGNAQNGIVDLGRFSLDDVEEITLYNGQKSDIFQPAKDFGSSGSIYIQPKRPLFSNGRKTNLILRLKNSSISLFNPSFRLEQRISAHTSASISGEYLESDGIYRFRYTKKKLDGTIAYDTLAKRYDSDIQSKRLETAIFTKLDRGSWEARAYAYQSNRGLPAPIVNGGFKERGQRLRDENYFLQTTLRKKLFPSIETQLKTKLSYDYTHYADTATTTKLYKIQNTYIQREAYLSSSNIYSINPSWDISLSADFQFNNLSSDLPLFSFPTRYTELVAFATTYQKGGVKVLGSLLGTFVQEEVKRNAASPDKSEWSPSLFLSYQLKNQGLNFRAFYKKSFRMPTFNDLYYTIIGTSNLQPEYTHQYNLGLSFQKENEVKILRQLQLKADVYFNKVENKIIAAPNGSMFRWMMKNLGYVEIIGTDIQLQTTLQMGNFNLRPLLNYTYQSAKNLTDKSDSYYNHQIPYTPLHSGSFSLISDYKGWGLHYSFIYAGKRYNALQNNIRYYEILPWYTHDIALQKEFKVGTNKFKVSLEANNLLNQYYEVVANYPMPGRNFKLVLNWNL